MNNIEIASIFYEIADILEMQDIAWKPRAYRQVAHSLESLSADVSEIYSKGGIKALEDIPGIGEGLAKKIVQYLETGKINEYERLKKTVPKHSLILIKIDGIGPKKAKKLQKELDIKSINQLEKAAKWHKIASLSGFGLKSEQDILQGIELSRLGRERIPYLKAKAIAEKIINILKKESSMDNIAYAGSLRRKRSLVGDIDILAASEKPEGIIDSFTKIGSIKKVIAKGPTRAAIILKSGVQVDIRVVKPESWGAALLYFTGSKSYNIEMRKIAIKKRWKLNEYGLFDKKTGKMIAGKTEQEVYEKLGLKYIDPEKREI